MKPAFLFTLIVATNLFAQSQCETSGPIPFHENGKWGYISATGVAVPPRFDSASSFTNDGATVCISDQCGLIGKDGTFLGPTRDRKIKPFPGDYSEGLAPTQNNDRWGYVDFSGNVVIPFQFVFAGAFKDGIAKVGTASKQFFINHKGERVTPEFRGVSEFHEGLAAVDTGKNIGYIDRDGTFALPPLHNGASGMDFSEGMAATRVNGKVGFMDKTGSILIAPKYDDAYPFSDGLAVVILGNKWGYVDKLGNVVIPIQYEIAHTFSEGVASVESGGKWGYIDPSGHYVIPLEFDSAMPFCGGVAAVETFRAGKTNPLCRNPEKIGKHGFINHSGSYVWRDEKEHTWGPDFCF